MVWSAEPEMIIFPSGLMATHDTSAVCPSSLPFSLPVSMSHTLRVAEKAGAQLLETGGQQVVGDEWPSKTVHDGGGRHLMGSVPASPDSFIP